MRKDHLSVLPNEKGDKSDKSAIFSWLAHIHFIIYIYREREKER